MRHTVTALTFLLCICYFRALYAADTVAPISVKDLISRAHDRFELFAVSGERVRESRFARDGAGEWPNPEIGAEYARKDSAGGKGSVYLFSATQEVPFPGKNELRGEIAAVNEKLAVLTHEEMRVFIALEVTRLAHEYAVYSMKYHHVSDRLTRLNLLNDYMKGRVFVSPQRYVESKIVQGKIIALEKDVREISTLRALSFLKLNLYVHMEDSPLPEIAVEWLTRPGAPALDELVGKAEQKGFMIARQSEILRRAHREAELASKAPYPNASISLFAGNETGAARERTFGGAISFPIPLMTMNRAEIERLKSVVKSEEHLLQYARTLVKNEITGLHARLEFVREFIHKHPMGSLDEMENAMRYADAEFIKGRVDFQSYLDLETETHGGMEMILDMQLEYITIMARIDFLTASAEK